MGKVFAVDVAKCNGCHNCQLACKEEHAGNDWAPYARSQPETGHFWLKLKENVCGSIPKVKIYYMPTLCNHCEKPACQAACPARAFERRDDGLLLLMPGKCTGCGACAEACPYEAIYHNEELGIYQKCTGCAHLLDNGYGQPRCVETCPTEALFFGEEEELEDFIFGADVRNPETGIGPRVYYRNIPGQFIAGTVYDPVEKEVVIGAQCRATVGGKTYHTVTDDYGDFWLADLPVGKFKVVIGAEGYEYKIFDNLSTKSSVNLGDIPLERTNKK